MSAQLLDRWFLVTTTPDLAENWARRNGLHPVVTVTPEQLHLRRREYRRWIAAAGAQHGALYSCDWQRQERPQWLELALALAPSDRRFLFDGEKGTLTRFGSLGIAVALGRLPVDLAVGASVAVRQASLGHRHLGRLATRHRPTRRGRPSRCVLMIWRGSMGASVGGSITHASGMASGLRAAGYRVALVTSASPPDQLAACVDECVVSKPPPKGSRVAPCLNLLAINAGLYKAASDVARRFVPDFVYARHEYLLTAPARLALNLDVPLVLEWNVSEVWMHRRYSRAANSPLERVILPLADQIERHTVAGSDLVVAVANHAAEMAYEAGAGAQQVMVLPNAADLDLIDSALRTQQASPEKSTVELGWVGSFGDWHGADVLVRAMALLPEGVRAVMIGDGRERIACESLANQLGVGSRIDWLGRMAHDSAIRRLALCDVLVSPHVPFAGQPFFGSPTKIFEYMGLGRPIVASRLGQIADVLEDGVTARLVEPGDVDALAAAIEGVLGSPDRAASLGRNARDVVQRWHTWQRRAIDLLGRLGLPCEFSSTDTPSW